MDNRSDKRDFFVGVSGDVFEGADMSLRETDPCFELYQGDKTLLYITGNNNNPKRIPLENALESEISELTRKSGWVFIGNKKENRPLADIYREAIMALPKLLLTDTD